MSLIQSYYILFLTWIKPIHFDGTTCNTFFSLLDKTFLLNARVQMLQYILSANIWALPFFYSFIENETKQRSNLVMRARGQREEWRHVIPLIWNITPSAFACIGKGLLSNPTSVSGYSYFHTS